MGRGGGGGGGYEGVIFSVHVPENHISLCCEHHLGMRMKDYVLVHVHVHLGPAICTCMHDV